MSPIINNIFDISVLILRKLFYPRHIIIFYIKKIYSLNFIIKFFIKKIIYRYTDRHDLRVFWSREYDINSYFNFKKFKSRELGGELRNCIKIKSKDSFVLKTKKSNLKLKISFFFNKGYKSKIKGNINVLDFYRRTVSELSDLTYGYWHEVTINKIKNKQFTVINNTDSDLFFSYSLKIAKKNKINNIIHLNLDSLDMETIKFGKRSSLMPRTINFFKKSIIFNNCFSSSEWTLPWACSYFKGEMPSKHRLTDPKNSKHLVSPYKNNIFDLIKKENYNLVGFGPKPIFNPVWNNVQTFDKFYPTKGSFEKKLDLINVSKKIIENLEIKNSNNFFFAHLMDSHFPWSNRGVDEEFEMGSFRSCDPYTLYHSRLGQQDTKIEPTFETKVFNQLIRYSSARIKIIDRNLSYLINYLKDKKILKNTIIILSSDHGATYHRGPRHLLNYKKTNVPLFIHHPDLKNMKIDNLVNNTVDLNNLVKLMIRRKNKKLAKAKIDKFNNKKEVISESIYGNRYKITIRSKRFSYHLSCNFDRKKNIINTNTVYYENILNFKETKKIKDKKLILNFRVILKKHLSENFKGKINWFN